MSMKHIFSFGVLVVSVAVAAQAAPQAKFHLSVPAHWGLTVLPPGDYKISLPENSKGNHQFVVSGDSMSGYVQPLVTEEDTRPVPGSYLRLVKVDGTYFISQFRSGGTGKTFGFSVPKKNRKLEMLDQGEVRVDVSGN